MNFKRNNEQGFTLIELLVVMSILSVITTSLYMSMMTGLVAHRKTEEKLIQKNEGDMFLVQFEHELRNSVPYYHPQFQNHLWAKKGRFLFRQLF